MRTSHTGNYLRFVCAGFLAAVLSVLIVLASPGPAYAGEQRVFDNGGLFDKEEKEALEQTLASFHDEWQMELGIMTTDDAGGKSTERLADDFYDRNGLGVGSDHSGALFVIDMDNREIHVSTLGRMADYLTDERIEKVLDAAYGYVSDGDYAGCSYAALKEISSYMEAGIPANQHDYIRSDYRPSLRWHEVVFAFVAAGTAAALPCISTVNQYKMKKEQKQALNYRFSYRGNSEFQYRLVNDLFLNRMVTQRRIPRNTGNSGSGRGPGSSAGRTTLHRSSSGRMHGGGGRKF
ncbi:TPM domain-containing protein [Clostridium transplantifaecale]|uniref:TPM domain-containing protein n=1 Tax=Clostridium transplantifaecale TaxID=2479838 RepID=UPI000F630BE2|nr:TPM domain-containing protein [Clostridium transplantifaecale]